MTEKELAEKGANNVFQNTLQGIFEKLDTNLLTAKDAAAKQAALDAAKKGIQSAQATYAECKSLLTTPYSLAHIDKAFHKKIANHPNPHNLGHSTRQYRPFRGFAISRVLLSLYASLLC